MVWDESASRVVGLWIQSSLHLPDTNHHSSPNFQILQRPSPINRCTSSGELILILLSTGRFVDMSCLAVQFSHFKRLHS
jgi:hypothetical protein